MQSCCAVLCLFAFLPIASAATIVSQTNPPGMPPSTGVGADSSESVAISWTMNSSYKNVNIAAYLVGSNVPDSGTAYLTTRIGPSTTTSAQVDSSPITFPVFGPVWQTLFSGLTLGPGTYYIVLSSTEAVGGGWSFAPTPLDVTAPGAQIGKSLYGVNLPSNAYAPADPYGPTYSNENFVFAVQGDPVNAAAVPEPAYSILVLIACGVIAKRRRR